MSDIPYPGTAGEVSDFTLAGISSWSRCVFSLVTILRLAILVWRKSVHPGLRLPIDVLAAFRKENAKSYLH